MATCLARLAEPNSQSNRKGGSIAPPFLLDQDELKAAREPLINVCEAVSAAKVAALGEAKISEPKRSEDGTRRVSSFSCVQKPEFTERK